MYENAAIDSSAFILCLQGGTGTGGTTQRIYTASQGALCGVSFQIGREYIIAGSYVTLLVIMSIFNHFLS